MHPFNLLLPLLPLLITTADAQLTLYNGTRPQTTTVSNTASITSSPANGLGQSNLPSFDSTRLTAPAAPSPPLTSYSLSFPPASLLPADRVPSIPIKGNLLGFSIELSVADTILGVNGKVLKPEFLNYLANIRNRAGVGPVVRVGGNSQEGSTLFADGLQDGNTIDKIQTSADVTDTPLINFSPNLFNAMSNITSLVNTEWYFGLAFNESDTDDQSPNVPLVAEYASRILGNSLRGLQIANEPDLYTDHNKRPSGWNVTNFVSEYTSTVQRVLANSPATSAAPAKFMGPSTCCEVPGFLLSDVVNAGFLDQNMAQLGSISVQQYPTNNCGLSGTIDPQSIFSDFLNHTSAEYWTAGYGNISATAVANGKDMVMMEMNSASCGGFPGLSDSFGAAMWVTDWALQLATFNFSAVLMHVGGQNVYYNPFTPPPSNMSTVYQWTTGSVYYATLIVAELFGQSTTARIVDMTHTSSIASTTNADGSTTSQDMYHPTYVVYEGDTPTRAILFNFVSDSSGASTAQVTLSFNGTATPTTAYVRYFSASDVAEQYNITWAGQTMGSSFSSDGTLKGTQATTNITCTANAGCIIPVPAPAIAVVFFNSSSLYAAGSTTGSSNSTAQATATFGTTVIGSGSATLNPQVLATSNGQNAVTSGDTQTVKMIGMIGLMAISGLSTLLGWALL